MYKEFVTIPTLKEIRVVKLKNKVKPKKNYTKLVIFEKDDNSQQDKHYSKTMLPYNINV